MVWDMDIPPQVKAKAIEAGAGFLLRLFESTVSSLTLTKVVSPTEEPKACSPCLIHQHVVLARGYIEGLHSRLHPDGTVPEGLGGTIAQSRTHLQDAMNEIPGIMGASPLIDTACRELSSLLPDIHTRLSYVHNMEEWDIVLGKLKTAENVAYAIPEALYRREPVASTAVPDDKIVILSADDYKILELAREASKGDPNARSEIQKLVGG